MVCRDVLDGQPTDALNGWDLRAAGADGLFGTPDDDVYDLRSHRSTAVGRRSTCRSWTDRCTRANIS